jgi:biotin operon repressor
MTCANAILDTLAGGPTSLKHLNERLPYGRSLINRHLRLLQDQGAVVRLRQGVYGLTGQTYTPRPTGRPRQDGDSVAECAEYFKVTRQRASHLVRSGLAWKEGDTWVRKHTRAGRPK